MRGVDVDEGGGFRFVLFELGRGGRAPIREGEGLAGWFVGLGELSWSCCGEGGSCVRACILEQVCSSRPACSMNVGSSCCGQISSTPCTRRRDSFYARQGQTEGFTYAYIESAKHGKDLATRWGWKRSTHLFRRLLGAASGSLSVRHLGWEKVEKQGSCRHKH